ncbi:hypothetical protein D3C73_1094040 [compost metagenome]
MRRLLNPDTGVIEDDIQLAKLLHRLRYQALNLLLIGDVHFDKKNICIFLFQFLLSSLTVFFVIVGDDHFGPFFQKSFYCGQPDTGSPSRDNCNLALKISHGDSSNI